MSLPKYRAYRPSGVDILGQLPAHWAACRMRYAVTLNPSKSEIAGLSRATEVSFVPMEAISDDGSVEVDRTRPISEVEIGYTYFKDGDVTFAKITPCFENGKGAIVSVRSGHPRVVADPG